MKLTNAKLTIRGYYDMTNSLLSFHNFKEGVIDILTYYKWQGVSHSENSIRFDKIRREVTVNIWYNKSVVDIVKIGDDMKSMLEYYEHDDSDYIAYSISVDDIMEGDIRWR